jgi:NAD(P)-dependent dehydrogenase (short-subunit alcohol dehydrogenase family)
VPLLEERRGLIVNVTSDAARMAYPGWGPYGASKAALDCSRGRWRPSFANGASRR